MPVDPDGQLDAQFGRLRSDVDAMPWADADAIRRRGDRRTRNHAIGGAAATLALIGGAGVGFFGAQTLGGDDDLAGVPREAPAVTTTLADPTEPSSPPADDETTTPPTQTTPADEPEPPESTDDETAEDSNPPPSTPDETAEETPTTDAESPDPTPGTLELQRPDDSLLEAAHMYPVNDTATWTATGTGSESGDVSACVPLSLTGVGATAASERTFDWGDDVTGSNAVGVFDSRADATRARTGMTDAIAGCTWGTANGPNDVALPAEAGEGDSAQWWFIGRSNDDGSGEFEVVAIVQRDATISLVAMRQPGMDYNADPAPTLVSAWEQLQP